MTADDISFDEMAEERYLEDEGDDSDDVDYGLYNVSSSGSYSSTNITTTTIAPSASPTYTYSVGKAPVQTQPTPIHTFDLFDMGIQQIGSFDSQGFMVNWICHGNKLPIHYPTQMANEQIIVCLPGPDYVVRIRGVYSKYFTNERRAAMGLQPL